MASAFEATVQFFKDGDNMAIVTDAVTEESFMQSVSSALAEMVGQGRFVDEGENTWEFQFSHWLPQISDIVCKLRGYKAPIEERRLLIAGRGMPPSQNLVFSTGAGLPAVDLAAQPDA